MMGQHMGKASQVEVGGGVPESPYVIVENFCRLVALRWNLQVGF